MIEIKNVSKTFQTADGNVAALKNVNLSIADGDIYGIIGMSGAGKSTLVRCINMLEKPTEGQVLIDGVDITGLSDKQLRLVRRDITMIFQGFNLLMQRTCLKNVCFPLELAGVNKVEARKKALELLDLIGLKDKANAYPAQLSGGQQQRVAIARALATNPKVLLCDEATSALDPNTTHSILELIREINQKLNITAVIITHQMSVVESICNKVAILDHGEVVEQGEVGEVFSNPKSAAGKRLVYPAGEEDTAAASGTDKPVIRVVFNGADATATPLIARMAVETGVEASISYAATRSLNEKIYGTMLLTVKDEEEVKKAVEFISKRDGIIAEEVEHHVG